jgi:putative membrane protein insertion efficiency factor
VVFIGGWRGRRRGYGGGYGGYGGGYGGYGGGYRGGYGGGYGGYGGGGCLRDLFFLESGCCLAELLGCGPQLLFVAPSALRNSPQVLRRAPEGRGSLGNRAVEWLLALITAYQRDVSPRRRPCCRYSPTCSHYAAEALRRHGLIRGLWLTVGRLVRCRPGVTGGYDPVPE